MGVVTNMNPWLKSILLIIVTAVLTRFIPFAEYFRNIYTFVHEMSHAVMTLLLSGNVISVHLFSDQSGVTYSTLPELWRTVPVSLAGYIGASLFVVLLFRWYAKGKQETGLAVLIVLTAIGLMVFIRNPFGMVWSAGLLALSSVALVVKWPAVRDIFYLIVSFICLVESAITPVFLLITAIREPSAAGDATNLDLATGIPSVAWAVVFVIVALWCAKVAVSDMFPHGRRARGR